MILPRDHTDAEEISQITIAEDATHSEQGQGASKGLTRRQSADTGKIDRPEASEVSSIAAKHATDGH